MSATAASSTPRRPSSKSMDGFSRAGAKTPVSRTSSPKTSPSKASTPASKTPKNSSSSTQNTDKTTTISQNSATRPLAGPRRPVSANHGRFMDFAPKRVSERPIPNPPVARPPRSRVPIKRSVSISTAYSNMPQMEEAVPRPVRRRTAVTAPDAMPEIAAAKESQPRRHRFPKITRSGAVNLPSAPEKPRRPAPRPVASRQPLISKVDLLDDTPPLMSDADLAVALAGFVDDDDASTTPSLSDNLSREASDFADEIDALDAVEDNDLPEAILDGTATVGDAIRKIEEQEQEDFVAEPRPLFEDDDAAENRTTSKSTRTPLNYSPTGNRSPFLSSVNVEKRPLSAGLSAASTTVSATSVTAIHSITSSTPGVSATKSVSSARSVSPTHSSKLTSATHRSSSQSPYKKHSLAALGNNTDDSYVTPPKSATTKDLIASTPEAKPRRISLIIAILLTIFLGAGVGAVIYLAFFQS